VQELEVRDQPINLMWSGGIDSTCMVNAFLANSRDRAQLRVLYSPYSYYEHPQYLEFLKSNRIETQDISGDVYRKIHFDGIFVTGDGGDELNASMDESFLEKYGHSVLSQSWKDFFWSRTQDSDFLDFCEIYFSRSQLDIQTVLQARWWFYAKSKLW
jgi:asparagine synthetase B (glutamine-hydrolysing)